MVTSSAPGKVYLFGEHAVVYGEPAVPCAIERRVHVTATEIDEGLRIHANDLQLDGFTVEYSGDGESHPDVDVAESLVEAGMGYVNEAVAQARDAADAPEAGFEISVEGDIPLGAGLGSAHGGAPDPTQAKQPSPWTAPRHRRPRSSSRR